MLDLLRSVNSFIGKAEAQFARKVGGVFVLRILGTVAGFGTNLILARTLGARGSGLYFLALTFIVIGHVLGRIGLDNVVIRFVAANAADGSWNDVRATVRKALLLASTASSLITLILFVATPWISEQLFGAAEATTLIRIMSLSITPAALTILLGQALKGIGHAQEAALIESVGFSITNLALIAPLITGWGVLGAGFSYLLSNVLMLLVGGLAWIRSLRSRQILTSAHLEASLSGLELVRVGIPLLWVASMSLVMKWTDTLMLGVWETPVSVGIYGNAMRTSMLISFILIAVNSVSAPRFAALHRRGETSSMGELARRTAGLMMFLALPVVLTFILLARQIMTVFGPEFAAGAAALAVLALGQFVNVSTGSVVNMLVMSGHERLVQQAFIVSAALNVILNALLIPQFGILGAAISTAVSTAGINLAATGMVRKQLGIWTLPFLGPRLQAVE